MRKLAFGVVTAIFILAAAACISPPAVVPTLHIESPSPASTASLSLDDRIAIQDAWALMTQGRLEKAQRIFARLDQKNPFVLAGYGYLASIAEDPAAAEAFFRAALEADPELTVAILGLGQVYDKSGKADEAYKQYLEVLKRDPENAFAKPAVEIYRERKTGEFAAEAERLIEAGEIEKGKESWLRTLEYAPKLKKAHLALARQFAKEKNYNAAVFHWKVLLAEDAGNKGWLREYAEMLYAGGQWSRSLDAYEQMLALDPGDKTSKDRIEQIKNRLGFIELPSQYDAIASAEIVTKEDVAAIIGIRLREALAELNPRPPVIIDITTSWAQRYIVKAASLEVMEVFANHTFQPKKTVNRAEMADILSRLVKVLKDAGHKIYAQIPVSRVLVADVPQEHYYFLPIATAVAYRLMDLAPDRTFNPDRPVTGREALKIFELLADLVD